MEITLNDLFKGNATKIKDKEYFPTEAYIEPFIKTCSTWTNDFIIDAIEAPQISITNTNDNIIYNRVYIQAVLPDSIIDNHKQVLGMIYALDTRVPVIKLFTGGLNMACTNLCVFNPDAIQVSSIEEKTLPKYDFLESCGKYIEEVEQKLNTLLTTSFENTDFNRERRLGSWINNAILQSQENEFAKVKLGTTDVITAYKNLFIDSKSDYYQNPENKEIQMFDVYNSFTDTICNGKRSDMITKPEKVLLLSKILDI